MTFIRTQSLRIISDVCSFIPLFLRRSVNTVPASIRPQLTDKQRRTVDSCCTIEVTVDRLSYASLCLDPKNNNSIILSSWNSLPLNLPSGKEFRPSVCSSVFKSVIQHLLHDIYSPEKSVNSQIALVYVSSKLSSASLMRAGFMGYLMGYLCTECVKHEVLPLSCPHVFTVNYSYRKHILSSWKPNFTTHKSDCILHDVESLFMLLPKLSITNNFKTSYCNIFNIDDDKMKQSSLLPMSLLMDMLFLSMGYWVIISHLQPFPNLHINFNHIYTKAFHCCNILKEQILANNNTASTMDILLRPVMAPSANSTNYPKDCHSIHQAVVTGYLSAFLSSTITSSQEHNVSSLVECPTLETLTQWIGHSPSHWASYLNQLFKNYPDITFCLLPKSKPSPMMMVINNTRVSEPKVLSNNDANIDSSNNNSNGQFGEEIHMHLQSSQLLSTYKCSYPTKHKYVSTTQFLLARCLFTCMYHLLHDNYSKVV
ncbi:unnamed protein product [Heterobilharzia americana]|nr:unnamed protein product [Heterobilharzia americana]